MTAKYTNGVTPVLFQNAVWYLNPDYSGATTAPVSGETAYLNGPITFNSSSDVAGVTFVFLYSGSIDGTSLNTTYALGGPVSNQGTSICVNTGGHFISPSSFLHLDGIYNISGSLTVPSGVGYTGGQGGIVNIAAGCSATVLSTFVNYGTLNLVSGAVLSMSTTGSSCGLTINATDVITLSGSNPLYIADAKVYSTKTFGSATIYGGRIVGGVTVPFTTVATLSDMVLYPVDDLAFKPISLTALTGGNLLAITNIRAALFVNGLVQINKGFAGYIKIHGTENRYALLIDFTDTLAVNGDALSAYVELTVGTNTVAKWYRTTYGVQALSYAEIQAAAAAALVENIGTTF